jgi:prepilin-type N-terminal cleavage/methylation domain-containing protein
METLLTREGRKEARGFTLVELLVVIAIIGILASLLTPVLIRVRQEGFKTDCKNNLRQIASAAQMYADDPHNRFFPFNPQKRPNETLTDERDALLSLELLTKQGFLDDPKIYLCKAAVDHPADVGETQQDIRTNFRLDDDTCSFTWRKQVTTVNDDSRTPISGDKRGGTDQSLVNHKDGRNVVFKGSNVTFYKNEDIEDGTKKETKRARLELIGFTH